MDEPETELRRKLLLEDKLLGEQRRRGMTIANLQFAAAATVIIANLFYTISPWTINSVDPRLIALAAASVALIPLTVMVCLNILKEIGHAVRMVNLRLSLELGGQNPPSTYSRLRKILRQLRDAA